MMLKKISLIVFVLILSFASVRKASAANFSLVALGSYSLYDASATVSTVRVQSEGTIGYGAGLLVEPTFGLVGVEFGAFYLIQNFDVTTTIAGVSTKTSTDSAYVHLPLLFRLHLGLVSLGIGGFYDHALDSGDESNYGTLAGLRTSFGPLFLEGQYAMGLKDFSGEKSNMVLALLGVTF